MRKILVTGASGFLGTRICRHFRYLSDTYTVIAPSHAEMDLTELKSVMDKFKENVPEIVIHCAAISDVRSCEDNPDFSYRINVEGTKAIAKACAEYHSKLIFCSSDQIYFGSGTMDAHKEDEEVNPVNQYGRQKREAESVCLSYCSDAAALRLSWMYDHLQVNADEHGDFLRSLMDALKQNQPVSYPVYDYRGITYVQDVVGSLEKVFDLPGGIYNFGSPNDMNTFDTVKNFIRELGLDEKKVTANEQAFAGNPRNIRMNIDKIKKLGISFPGTAEGLKKQAELYRDK